MALRGSAGGVQTINNASGNTTGLTASSGQLIQFPDKLALPYWRAALGKMRNGQQTARLAIIGSSTVTSHGAGTRDKGLIHRVTQMLNDYYAPASSGNIFGGGFGSIGTLTAFDDRITFGPGWVHNTTDAPLGAFSFLNNTDTTSLLQFTPDEPFDEAVIYYSRTTTSGNFTASIDGGVTPLVSSGNGTEALQAMIVPGLSLGNHTLTIKPTSLGTGGVNIQAIRTSKSTSPAIEVFGWGQSGGTANNFIQTGKPWSSYNAISTYAPDMSLFVVASNVWTGGQTIGTFKSQMQTLISRLKEKGDVGIVAGIPTLAADVSLATQRTYIDAAQELAILNGLPFIDNWRRFGSAEQASTRGLMFDNSYHLNGAGYSDFAMPIFKLLTEM